MTRSGTLAAAIAVLATTITGCDRGRTAKPAAPPAPASVVVVPATTRDLPDQRRYPGTTQAVEQVTLVARVEGFLERRLFDEGAMVKAGQPMFVLEQAPYEAAVLQAQGVVREAEAQLADARMVYERNRPLAETGAISEQEFDGYVAAVAVAEGTLEAAIASRLDAEIRLGYTEIATPIAGRVGERFVDVGNLVGAAGGPSQLATVVSLDPIRVVFEPSGREAADYLAAWPSTQVKVVATVPGVSTSVTLDGTLDLVDNTADSGTSTVLVRASFPNPDGHVLPGLAVDLLVDLGTLENRIVVPSAAIRLDPQDAYVWTVKAGKLARQVVGLGVEWQGMRAVTGLDEDELVVVAGNPVAMRTGARVDPTRETLDDFLKKASDGGDSKSAEPASAHPAQSPTAKAGGDS